MRGHRQPLQDSRAPLPRIALAAAIALLLLSACSGRDDDPPPASTTSTPAPPADTATPSPGESGRPTPTPDATATPAGPAAPERHVFERGATVDIPFGVLFLDPASGGATVWQLPTNGTPRLVSPSGRYIAWTAPAAIGNSVAIHVLDTESGDDTVLHEGAGRFQVVEFASGESRLLAASNTDIATYGLPDLDRQDVLAEGESEPDQVLGTGAFSPDGANVAALDRTTGDLTVLLGDEAASTVLEAEPSASLRWSPDGRSLLWAGTDSLGLLRLGSGVELRISTGGANPRFSDSGDYFALSDLDGLVDESEVTGARVFDARSGDEVLRASGVFTCVGDYFVPGRDAIQYDVGRLVTIPGGTVGPWPGDPRTSVPSGIGTPGLYLDVDEETGAQVLTDGFSQFAEIVINATWSVPLDFRDGAGQITDDGRAVFYLGVGGRGFCLSGEESVYDVFLPPFDD